MKDPAKALKNLKLYCNFYQKNGSYGGSRFSQNGMVQLFFFFFFCSEAKCKLTDIWDTGIWDVSANKR